MTNEERNELVNEIILYIKSRESKYVSKNDFDTAHIYQSLRDGIRAKFAVPINNEEDV